MDNLAARTEKRAKLKQFLRASPSLSNKQIEERIPGTHHLLIASVREELRKEGVEGIPKPRGHYAARDAMATTKSPITQRLDEKPIGRIESPQMREQRLAKHEPAVVVVPEPRRPKLTEEDEEILRDVVTTMDKANEVDSLRAQVKDLDNTCSELAAQLEEERSKNSTALVVPERTDVDTVVDEEEDTRDALIEWYEQREIDLCKCVAEQALEIMQLKAELGR